MITPHPAHPRTPESRDAALIRYEGRLLIEQGKVVEALSRLSKIFTVGYSDSGMNAAMIELRSAANGIEKLRAEWLNV